MWWRRKTPRYRPLQPPTTDELRRRAAEEDRVCAMFGPDCEQVDAQFDMRNGHYLAVTYRGGRVRKLYPVLIA